MDAGTFRILILNGPNLNMLGLREPEIYGSASLEDIRELCEIEARIWGAEVDFRQSNHEGALIDWVQEAAPLQDRFDALLINAGAYTHTSLALHDALRLLRIPIIEVHLSDPKKREAFRHHSFIEPLAAEVISGLGPESYKKAIASAVGLLRKSA